MSFPIFFIVGSGFLFDAVAGYAIKKVMKIAAVVIGLFVVGWSIQFNFTNFIYIIA